jgi:hypothetical protein
MCCWTEEDMSEKFYSTYEIMESDVKEQLTCSVCLQEFYLGRQAIRLVCAHLFHCCCIFNWLSNHKTCPLCRSIVMPDTIEIKVLNGDSDDDDLSDYDSEVEVDLEQEIEE